MQASALAGARSALEAATQQKVAALLGLGDAQAAQASPPPPPQPFPVPHPSHPAFKLLLPFPTREAGHEPRPSCAMKLCDFVMLGHILRRNQRGCGQE